MPLSGVKVSGIQVIGSRLKLFAAGLSITRLVERS